SAVRADNSVKSVSGRFAILSCATWACAPLWLSQNPGAFMADSSRVTSAWRAGRSKVPPQSLQPAFAFLQAVLEFSIHVDDGDPPRVTGRVRDRSTRVRRHLPDRRARGR